MPTINDLIKFTLTIILRDMQENGEFTDSHLQLINDREGVDWIVNLINYLSEVNENEITASWWSSDLYDECKLIVDEYLEHHHRDTA